MGVIVPGSLEAKNDRVSSASWISLMVAGSQSEIRASLRCPAFGLPGVDNVWP